MLVAQTNVSMSSPHHEDGTQGYAQQWADSWKLSTQKVTEKKETSYVSLSGWGDAWKCLLSIPHRTSPRVSKEELSWGLKTINIDLFRTYSGNEGLMFVMLMIL